MDLHDLYTRNPKPLPWVDIKSNLPWGELEFSKRMLAEQLDPSHDLGSRRPVVMSAQVAWMTASVLKPRDIKVILDLTCGPGLWANSLARLGFTVRGIDVSPAAIDHARTVARDEKLSTTYVQGDILDTAFGSGYGAAMILYGEGNTFRWEEFSLILLKIRDSLDPKGILVLELMRPEALARLACSTWQTRDSGVFGDRPYLWLSEGFWNPETLAGGLRHYAVDIESGRVREYGVSYQCYVREHLQGLFRACGFEIVEEYDSLIGETGLQNPEWHVVVAQHQAT